MRFDTNGNIICENCGMHFTGYHICKKKTITQGDRIKKMDNRELAKQFVYFDVSTNRIRTLHTPSSYLKIEDAIDAEECWLSLPVEGEQK